MPAPDVRGWRLKAYEDKLDAVVCAAVGIACLNGEAEAYGDNDSAVWVPISEDPTPVSKPDLNRCLR